MKEQCKRLGIKELVQDDLVPNDKKKLKELDKAIEATELQMRKPTVNSAKRTELTEKLRGQKRQQAKERAALEHRAKMVLDAAVTPLERKLDVAAKEKHRLEQAVKQLEKQVRLMGGNPNSVVEHPQAAVHAAAVSASDAAGEPSSAQAQSPPARTHSKQGMRKMFSFKSERQVAPHS